MKLNASVDYTVTAITLHTEACGHGLKARRERQMVDIKNLPNILLEAQKPEQSVWLTPSWPLSLEFNDEAEILSVLHLLQMTLEAYKPQGTHGSWHVKNCEFCRKGQHI